MNNKPFTKNEKIASVVVGLIPVVTVVGILYEDIGLWSIKVLTITLAVGLLMGTFALSLFFIWIGLVDMLDEINKRTKKNKKPSVR